MPVPFYSLSERQQLAMEDMRQWLEWEVADDQQTVDHFLARTQSKKNFLSDTYMPHTADEFAALILTHSRDPMPYAVATGDTLGDIFRQFGRFHIRLACNSAARDWAEDIEASGALDNLWGGV